jgi:FdhD protein
MATPSDLEDFALGFSCTEGIIAAAGGEIAELRVICVLEGIVLQIWLSKDRSARIWLRVHLWRTTIAPTLIQADDVK